MYFCSSVPLPCIDELSASSGCGTGFQEHSPCSASPCMRMGSSSLRLSRRERPTAPTVGSAWEGRKTKVRNARSQKLGWQILPKIQQGDLPAADLVHVDPAQTVPSREESSPCGTSVITNRSSMVFSSDGDGRDRI